MLGVSAKPSLAQEISELLDNAQKAKNFQGSRKLSQARKKCAMK